MNQQYGHHKIDVFDNSSYYFGKENSAVPNYHLEVLSGQMTASQAMKLIRIQLKKKIWPI